MYLFRIILRDDVHPSPRRQRSYALEPNQVRLWGRLCVGGHLDISGRLGATSQPQDCSVDRDCPAAGSKHNVSEKIIGTVDR